MNKIFSTMAFVLFSCAWFYHTKFEHYPDALTDIGLMYLSVAGINGSKKQQ